MYVLGVDGGGTKIEFMLTNTEGIELLRFQYEENTNLKYTTSQNIIRVLKTGLQQIQESFDIKLIKFAYLGIAECGENCVGKGREQIYDFLASQFANFELADDQYSVFRAKSDDKNGVLANAGTGSNINHFYNGQEKNYKSVGIGGRDLGHLFLSEIANGGLEKDISKSQIYKHTAEFLEEEPIAFMKKLKPLEVILNTKVSRLTKHLILSSLQNSILNEEIDTFAIVVASRWVLKLTSYCSINFEYKSHDHFNLALTGSLWRWDMMREIVLKDYKSNFPQANIIFDPDKKPVLGAVKIALENVS
ncbi:MAG: BadF/BadG/BcrA/BcrD ATPase family protein [Patescibacteria group bacterium]